MFTWHPPDIYLNLPKYLIKYLINNYIISILKFVSLKPERLEAYSPGQHPGLQDKRLSALDKSMWRLDNNTYSLKLERLEAYSPEQRPGNNKVFLSAYAL